MEKDTSTQSSAYITGANEGIGEVQAFQIAYRRFRSLLLLLGILAAILGVHLGLKVHAGVQSGYDIAAVGLLVAAVLVVGIGLARCLGMVTARAAERLERLAFRDDLTGAYNVRYVLSRLREEIARTRRTVTPLSVVYLDLDHFKQINDRYGHERGNSVLQRVVEVFTANVRASDIVGRIGGDEFLLVLPGTALGGAKVVAERCLGGAEAIPNGEAGESKTDRIRISAGVVEFGPGDRKYERDDAQTAAERLIAAADHAMYLAKRKGSGRIEAIRRGRPSERPQLASQSDR